MIAAYVDQVSSGLAGAGRWERLAVDRYVRDLAEGKYRGIWFDEAAALRACRFFDFLKHSKGEWAGTTLRLEPWQLFKTWNLFGWRRADGQRRFRTGYVEVARKNGKMLAMDTAIPTPQGWTTIGEIQAGDAVFAPDGSVCRVTRVSDVDAAPVSYRMTFSNGEVIVACADHQWVTTARVDSVGAQAEKRRRTIRRWKGPHRVDRPPYVYVQTYGKQVYVGRADLPGVDAIVEELMAADLAAHPVGMDTRTRIRTTQEIFETQRCGNRGDINHSLRMPAPLQLPDQVLPIDPYVLGVWLGDGTTSAANVTVGAADVEEMVGLLKSAGETVKAVKRRGTYSLSVGARRGRENEMCQRGHGAPDWDGKRCKACERMTDYARRHGLALPGRSGAPLLARLRDLGVLGNKHIPRVYLRGSYGQRLALLQGLMDSDGTVSKSGLVFEYVTVVDALADGVCELLATMGVKFSRKGSDAKLEGRVVGRKWRIQFNAFADEVAVFRLGRKLGRMRRRSDQAGSPRSRSVQIVAVEACDPVPMRCIEVDHPSHEYLCGRTMLPTHNTTWAAGVGLFLMDADNEPGAEIYTAAVKRDQARIAHQEATRMVKSSPLLRKRIRVFKDNLHNEKTASKFEPLGRDADSTDGLNVHGAIVDEVHAHPTRDMWDVLETATGARRQPLIVGITTAGFDRNSLCWELHEYSERVLDGSHVDDSWFGAIYAVEPEDDPFDESVWRKANPNLGVSVKLDDMRRLASKAQEMPSALNAFLRLRLNRWTQSVTRWMPIEAWERCGGFVDPEGLRGRTCYGGLDLSSTTDVSALVWVFPPEAEGEGYQVLCRFFIPEESMRERSRRDRVPYEAWVRQGLMTATPGNVIDYSYILAQVDEDAQRYDIGEIAFDRWGATRIVQDLEEGGLAVAQFGQGFASMSSPMKELEKLVLAGEIRHGGNPVLTWMAGNLVAREDPAGNIKPDKQKSTEKIDGMVSLIMGLDRAIRREGPGASVYEERGVLSV